MMPRARCVIRYLYRSARVAGVEPARILANGEKQKAAATRRRSRDPPPRCRKCAMRSKGQEALNNLDLRAGGERGSGAKSWLERHR